MSFWETCFGSNKSLRAAVECNPVLWKHLVLVESTFFLVSRLTFLIIYFGLPCVRTRSWKMLVIKPRGEGEQRLECSPVAPCRQPLQSSPACLYLKRKRGRLSPPLPLLMISFSFFLPWSQRRLVTRVSRRRAEPHCKAPFQLRGESAVD